MASAVADGKNDVLLKAGEVARTRKSSGGPPLTTIDELLQRYYRHAAAEDVAARSAVDLYGALASHYRFAHVRPQGRSLVRVFTPTVAEHGWSAGGHTVVEVVTKDMPFLVDSVTMTLGGLDHTVHQVIHPRFDARRDLAGELHELRAIGDEPPVSAADSGDIWIRESWMHIEIDRIPSEECAEIEKALASSLADVRAAVDDWPRMQQRLVDIVEDLRTAPPPSISVEELGLGIDFLTWLSSDHFAFLGYREYALEGEGAGLGLRAVAGSGLGILRGDQFGSSAFDKLPPLVRAKAKEKKLLVLAKANSKSTVHRPAHLDYVGVKRFDEAGNVIGERRFLGLFSAAAYTDSVTRIPLLREKVAAILAHVGFDAGSHAGKSLVNVLENYPRDELFHTTAAELVPIAEEVMHTTERRQLRLFMRRDTYGRYLSCLVYLPRDRYNTGVREKFAAILLDALDGESIEFSVKMNESFMAQVHFVVRPPAGKLIKEHDTAELERRLADAARSWRDDFVAAVTADQGEEAGSRLARRYVNSFPEAYKEDFTARAGSVDMARLEAIEGAEGLNLSLYEDVASAPGESRLKVYRIGSPLSLSQILPMLSSTGVEVVDERPYELEGLDRPTYVYEFGLRYPGSYPVDARPLFTDAMRAIWDGFNEIDGFNALVLSAGLTWRQATVLRAYAKYMKQGNTPFALDTIEAALKGNVDITRLLIQLFEARFDPAAGTDGSAADRTEKVAALEDKILRSLDDVASLDHDRILRSYLAHLKATLRTNYFQPSAAGGHRSYLSFKLEPTHVPDLPEPRPKFEIFVYSPRVEGVHLRFGSVARGGLRWSDRRDDFRTEVLGLVKAQMVKNTVIVPVGAKGGFYCKQLPDSGDRDAWMAEGIACYKTFISGLLDITDNLSEGAVVPPRHVVRHDADDPYLVVAADKGTATFSDIANSVSRDYGFWLGDAFASGGSVGYDHKAMGITAKGAWVSVQRHFREMGIDCQTQDFTAVGIGDMSGDVFGNGMLLSEHTRLIAAFDHRDIFIDPDPDAAASFAERRRMFALPRSSWADYDKSLISAGGGVFPRSAKQIPISPEMARALGLVDAPASMPPLEVLRAILKAPVDLLWNGGIGTYVKAEEETHGDVGDKANDGLRINGAELRAKCVGEGGNLGFTQLGRIEYAIYGAGGKGGRINTDFIDNSAGVDTSDHEVNIKILLDRVVADGDLTTKQRNTLLATMTDEVGELVLRDNYEQNLALANASHQAPGLLHVHEEMIRHLERNGWISRELEGLPTTRQIRRRQERGRGLTSPELSVLMAWTKIVLAEELLTSELPDDPFLNTDLYSYFPSKMQDDYRPQMLEHPLRRQIIVTQVVNDLVNGAGMTFWWRLAAETGSTAAELVNANFVAREIFGSLAFRTELATFDNELDAALQTRMRLEMRTLVERASRWLVTHRRAPLDSAGVAEFFAGPVQETMKLLPDIMTGKEHVAFVERTKFLIGKGVPEDLAVRTAVLPSAYPLLSVIETATREGLAPADVARTHFGAGERLGLPAVVGRIVALPREDRWQTMARAALRDELYDVHAQLTSQVLAAQPGGSTEEMLAAWEVAQHGAVTRAAETLAEICSDDQADLARMSVALRVVRGLLA